MAVYGSYETVGRSLSQAGFTALWRARKGGTGAAAYAVKTLEPPSNLVAPEDMSRRTDRFLESAGVQAGVAAGEAKHWAAVHEQGKTAEGAFYVADYYPRSIRSLIQGRARLSGRSMLAVVSGIIDGLRELDAALSRPHGNLKPTNILISAGGEARSENLVLTDPLVQGELDERSAAADLAALGDMIFRLVCHKSFNPATDWPVADTPEWRMLGRTAGAWRELCSLLLSPNLASQGVGLEEVAGRLESISEAERKVSKTPFILGALGLLALVVLFGVLWFVRAEEPQKDVQFAQLSEDYDKWFGRLANAGPGDIDADLWGKDEHLGRILQLRDGARSSINGIRGDEVLSLGLRSRFEDLGGRDKSRLGAKLKDAAVRQNVAAASKCAREIAEAYNSWQPEAVIGASEQAYRSRGGAWEGRAATLARIRKPELAGDAIGEIERIARLTNAQDGVLVLIEKHWNDLSQAELKMNATEDPILLKFKDYCDDIVKTVPSAVDGLAELEKELGKAAELASELAGRVDGVWSGIDRQCFIETSDVHKDFRAEGVTPDKGVFDDWIAAVGSEDYRVNPELNAFVTAISDETRQAIEKALAEASDLAKFLPAEGEKGGALEERLDEMWGEVEEGRKKQVCLKSRGELDGRAAASRESLAALAGEVDKWKQALEEPAQGEDPRDQINKPMEFVRMEIERVVDAGEKARLAQSLARIGDDPDLRDLQGLRWIRAYEQQIADAPALTEAIGALEELRTAVASAEKHSTIDPRPELKKSRDRTVAGLTQIETLGAAAVARSLSEKLDAISAQIRPAGDWNAYLGAPDWEGANQAQRNRISSDAAALAEELRPVEEQVTRLLTALREQTGRAAMPAGTPAAISDFWRAKHAEIMSTATGTGDLSASFEPWPPALSRLGEKLYGEGGEVFAGGYLVTAAQVYEKKRDELVAKALASPQAVALQDLDAIGADVAGRLAGLRDGISQLSALAAATRELLDEASLPSEIAPSYDKLTKHGLFGDFRGELDKIASRVAGVAQIESEGRNELLQTARNRDDPALAFNAWRKLDQAGDWPGSVADIEAALLVVENLSTFIRSSEWIKDMGGQRRTEVMLACRGYLERCLRLAAGADQSQMSRTVELLGQFANPEGVFRAERLEGITVDRGAFVRELSALQDPARYNIGLWELNQWVENKGWLNQPGPGPDEEKIKRHIQDFVQAKIPASLNRHPEVERLRGELETLEELEASAAEASQPWPAPSGWERKQAADGTSVLYTWKRGGRSHELEFRLVSAGGGETFLCTTEVSLGLFADVVTAAGKWRELENIWDAAYMVSWSGPRVWEWLDSADSKLVENSEWWLQPPTELAPAEDYEKMKRQATDMPSSDHPLQYVSPQAALFVATQLGFRLPTADEWRAAWQVEGKPATGNLRDKKWKDFLDHVNAVRRGEYRYSGPEGGIFALANQASSNNPVSTADDGRLWFAEVGSGGGGFRHLVGNVAEFVSVKDDPGRFSIIGASALSPPELWDGANKPFDAEYPFERAKAEQFSDVGFRFAFTAPRKSLVEAVRKALKDAAYLGPPASGS